MRQAVVLAQLVRSAAVDELVGDGDGAERHGIGASEAFRRRAEEAADAAVDLRDDAAARPADGREQSLLREGLEAVAVDHLGADILPFEPLRGFKRAAHHNAAGAYRHVRAGAQYARAAELEYLSGGVLQLWQRRAPEAHIKRRAALFYYSFQRDGVGGDEKVHPRYRPREREVGEELLRRAVACARKAAVHRGDADGQGRHSDRLAYVSVASAHELEAASEHPGLRAG